MKSKVAKDMSAKVSDEIRIFTEKYADLVVLINQILAEKGFTKKDLAETMNKHPSEIHRWLTGEHNFTIRSLCKLESELKTTLIEVPVRKTKYSEGSIIKAIHWTLYSNSHTHIHTQIKGTTTHYSKEQWSTNNIEKKYSENAKK